MTFHPQGFRTIGAMGIPVADAPAGSVRQLHTFVTNDDAPTVETANYFDALLSPVVKVQAGDLLLASLDLDGTPVLGFYQFTVSGGHVVIKTAAGAQVTALAGTLTGTIDGTIADVSHIALATSGGNTYSDAAVNTAVNAAIDSVNTQLKELQAKVNALTAAL